MRTWKIITGAMLASAFMIACENTTRSGTTEDTVARSDKTMVDTDSSAARDRESMFVTEVMIINNNEIRYAQQALKKATNAGIKQFANMLIEDHTTSAKELRDLAIKKLWNIDTEEANIPADVTNKIKDMEEMETNKFERHWLEMMEDDHEKEIRKFENMDATDADLKAFIDKTLPKLRAHHDQIKGLQKNLK